MQGISLPSKNFEHTLLLEKKLYQQNFIKGYKFTKKLAPFLSWDLIGPFFKYSCDNFNCNFFPEIVSNLAEYKESTQKAIRIKNLFGYFFASNFFCKEPGVAYLKQNFTVSNSLFFHFFLNGKCKVFINGKMIFQYLGDVPKYVKVKIENTKNVSVMVKFLLDGKFQFRLLATDLNYHSVKIQRSNFKKNFVSDFSYEIFEKNPFNFVEKKEFKNKRKKKSDKNLRKKLLKSFSLKNCRLFLNFLIKQKKYKEAIVFISRYNVNAVFDKELLSIFLKIKKFKKARLLLLKQIFQNEKPQLFYSLGMLDKKDGRDPAMYFKKAFSLNAGFKKISAKYSPYGKILQKKKKQLPLQKKNYVYFSFLINENLSNRLIVEKNIYLKTNDNVKSFKKQIFLKGNPYFLEIKKNNLTLQKNRDFELYQKKDKFFLIFKNLKKEDVLSIKYQIMNPLYVDKGNAFLFSNKFYLTGLQKILCEKKVKVFASSKLKIKFFYSRGVFFQQKKIEDAILYTLFLKNNFMDKKNEKKQFYCFSTVKDKNLFFLAFNQYLEKIDSRIKKSSLKLDFSKLKNKKLVQKIKLIYDFVNKKDIRFSSVPVGEKNTFILKRINRNSIKKSFLTHHLLEKVGIKSFVAFPLNIENFSEKNKFCPYYFQNILLYIPINKKKYIWLDFSSPKFSLPEIKKRLINCSAYILVGNKIYIKKISP